MPTILTCIVGKRLGESPQEDHWALRSTATDTVLLICRKYGASYHTLQPRVTRTLLRAFMDPEKPFTTHYGAILGLSRMGTEVFRTLVVPNLKTYSVVLEPELEDENMMEIDADGTETPALKSEAAHCRDALLVSDLSMFVNCSPFKRMNHARLRFNRCFFFSDLSTRLDFESWSRAKQTRPRRPTRIRQRRR